MKTDSHKASPEIISALLAKIKTLEPQHIYFLSTMADFLKRTPTPPELLGDWTDEELHELSLYSLQRAWDVGDEDLIAQDNK